MGVVSPSRFAKRHTRAMVPAVTGFKTSDEAPSRYADGASSRVEAVLRGRGRCLGAFDTRHQTRFNTDTDVTIDELI